MAKRCPYCGRYFIPDRRVGARQKACRHAECKRKRKQQAQRLWTERNPGYFHGRYEYVKEWRRQKRQQITAQAALQDKRPKVIQDEIPSAKPYQQLVLLIPADKTGMIQDEIRLRRVAPSTFAAYG